MIYREENVKQHHHLLFVHTLTDQIRVGLDLDGRPTCAMSRATHGIGPICQGRLVFQQFALGSLHHEMIHERQGDHGFHHGNSPGQDTRIVASLATEFDFLAVPRDRSL